MNALIPIVVLNWNGLEDTMECIVSLLEMDEQNFKIYLIDNASEKEEVAALKAAYLNHEKITLILNSSNKGFCKAHIDWYHDYKQQLEAPYICLLNNDTVVEKSWLKEMVKLADQSDAGMISSKMIYYYDRTKLDNVGHKMLNTGEIIPIGHAESVDSYTSSIENIGACAGAALYRISMIEDIGFFDDYFSTGYEDAEFGYRSFALAYKSLLAPNAIVYHKMGKSIKKIFNLDYSIMIQKSIWYTYLKVTPTFVLLLNLPFIIFKLILIILIDIVFIRFSFLKTILKSIKKTWNDKTLILKQRRIFQSKYGHRIRSRAIMKKQIFFLFFDIKRFYNIILLRKPSSLDQYGNI